MVIDHLKCDDKLKYPVSVKIPAGILSLKTYYEKKVENISLVFIFITFWFDNILDILGYVNTY